LPRLAHNGYTPDPESECVSAQLESPVIGSLNSVSTGGPVLFSRFHQPDYDLGSLEAARNLALTTANKLPARIPCVATPYGRIKAEMAVAGGVHIEYPARQHPEGAFERRASRLRRGALSGRRAVSSRGRRGRRPCTRCSAPAA
jgi:hypothetical protein